MPRPQWVYLRYWLSCGVVCDWRRSKTAGLSDYSTSLSPRAVSNHPVESTECSCMLHSQRLQASRQMRQLGHSQVIQDTSAVTLI